MQTIPRWLKTGREGHEFIHMSRFPYFPLVNSQIIDCGSIISINEMTVIDDRVHISILAASFNKDK